MSTFQFYFRRAGRRGLVALVAVTAAATARAQRPPAPRPIGAVEHFTTDSLASAATALQMGGGKVLVNDITGRRVLLFDSTLAHPYIVADTTDATANAYGTRPGTLIRYKGDSALYIDIGSLSMLVIDPAGKIVRVMAVPNPDDAQMLIGSVFGLPGFDAKGRLVHYAEAGMQGTFILCCVGTSRPQLRDPSGVVPKPDSGIVVAVDMTTRAVDTLTYVKIANARQLLHIDANGYLQSIEVQENPIPVVDDWAVMPGGTIAVVRGRDYHVDWLDASGRWTSSPKMPFDWQRVDDTRKLALIDSGVRAREARNAEDEQRRAAMNAAPASGGAAGTGGRGSGRGGGRGGGGRGGTPIPEVVGRIDPRALPDFVPPFVRGAVEPDADGHLWIKTSALVDGRPVYDVVNRQGELIDRVFLPPYRTIAGFGPGVVYLGVKDPSGAVHLERVRIR